MLTPIETESRIVGMYLQHNPTAQDRSRSAKPGNRRKAKAALPVHSEEPATGCLRRANRVSGITKGTKTVN